MDLTHVEPTALAEIMASDSRDEHWTEADLATILEHQFKAPVVGDLSFIRGISDRTVEAAVAGAEPAITSFGDLLASEAPPLILLELTKEYGKYLSRERAGVLPPEIGTALYYAAIGKGILSGHRISSLSDEQLASGLRWHLELPWLIAPLRSLFLAALERLARPA